LTIDIYSDSRNTPIGDWPSWKYGERCANSPHNA